MPIHPLHSRPRPRRLLAFLLGALASVAVPEALPAVGDGPPVLVGQTVQFEDLSSDDASSWEWDFSWEEGILNVDSRAQHPTWSYDEVGLWSIRLEVCNVLDCSERIKQIQVALPCSLDDDDLVLPPQTVATTMTYEACHTVTAGDGFTVAPTGVLTLRAGHNVALESGFAVDTGGSLTVEVDPVLGL